MKNTIIRNGNIFMAGSFIRGDIVIKDGRIIDAGKINTICINDREFDIINLDGNTILPSFFDSHTHFYTYAVSLNLINIEDCSSIDEIKSSVKAFADGNDSGVIFGRGWSKSISNKKIPTRFDLDDACGDRPVLLESKDTHSVILNSKALEFCGIDIYTHVQNGIIERDGKNRLNGLLAEDAVKLAKVIYDRVFDLDEMTAEHLIEKASRILTSLGISSIFNVENTVNTLRIIKALKNKKFYQRFFTAVLDTELDKAGEIPDEYLRGVKCFLDGALGNLEAAMLRPYNDHNNSCGVLMKDYDGLLSIIKRCYGIKLPAVIHAIGDRANRTALDALKAAGPVPSSYPNRIEHGQLLFPEFLKQGYPADIIFSMQPSHLLTDIKPIMRFWGEERARYAFAFNMIRQNGNTIIFNTDLPIEKPDPLYGIYAAVKRRDKHNFPVTAYVPEQAISVQDAIASYTTIPHKIYNIDNDIKKGNKPSFIIYNREIPFDDLEYEKIKDYSVLYHFFEHSPVSLQGS